jgi:adenosine kinase
MDEGMMTIICTGSIAFDYLMSFPGYFRDHILPESLDSISLSFLVDSMVRQPGGTGPNIAYTLALLGERPILVGTVGDDFSEYRAWLESKGVDTRFVRVIQGEYSASFFANTDLSNNQIASFYTGAMAHASEINIQDLLGEKPELVVISPNDPKAMSQYAVQCQELGIPYLYDPSQQIVRLAPEELRKGVEGAQSLFVNEYEFELLQKHTRLTSNQVLSLVEFMVVTLGSKGAIIYVEGEEYRIPVVPPEKMADPTGVGDAFRGGFLRGYRLRLDWQTCGQMGALAATYCLEKRGPQNHSYTPAEFVARYRQCFDDRGSLNVLLAQS